METTHEGLVLLQSTDVSDREMEEELSSKGDGQVGESLSSVFIQPTCNSRAPYTHVQCTSIILHAIVHTIVYAK